MLALAQGDILSEAWKGNPEAGFPSSRTKIRLVGAAYPNFIHLVAREDAGIHSLRDLIGKRVSVGAARSGNELNARALLGAARSEEHTSELQSLMRISFAVFCLKKKKIIILTRNSPP